MQSLIGQLVQVEFLTHKACPLPEAEMAHTLQRVLAGEPLHLLTIQHPRATTTLDPLNDEISSPPSSYDLMLAGKLDASSIEDLRRPQPLLGIGAEAAKPEKDHEGLGLH